MPAVGAPDFTPKGVLHALCNAHHRRQLKALVAIGKEGWHGGCSANLHLA